MDDPGFIVYIDESGDEGFNSKCGRWFILCASVYPARTEYKLVKALDEVRDILKKPRMVGQRPHFFHFRDLKHDHRIPLIHKIAETGMRAFCVRVDKHAMQKTQEWGGGRLYWYICKFLLERVSWECKRWQKELQAPNSKAYICFSNRSSLKYEDFFNYLENLKRQSSKGNKICSISWSVIDPTMVCAYHPSKRAGLQIVDAVCGAFYYAYEDRYGFYEKRYLQMLESAGVIIDDKVWPDSQTTP